MAADSFIHRFVPGAPGAPTLLLLHGTGGDEDNLLDLGRALSPDSALLSPRGKVLENGTALRFFRRFAEGVIDEDDLVARTHELADFVGDAAAEYGFDVGRVVAVGYSNGANIASATLLLRPEVLRGAVLLRAMVSLTSPTLPDLGGKPVFVAGGRADALVPPANTEQLAEMLRQAGADLTLRWSEAGHPLTLPEIEAAHEWLKRHF